MKYLDIPKYSIRPRAERFLIDKILILFGLGILLYIGIYVNYYLLGRDIPVSLNIIFITSIVLLCIIELILCYLKYSNYNYTFYDTKVIINKNKKTEINYSEIKQISYATNFIDKRIKTGSIILELKNDTKVTLKYLDNPNQAYFLIQKSLK